MSRIKGWMKLYPRDRKDETVWKSLQSNTKLIINRVRDKWYVELFQDELMAVVCIDQIGDSFPSKDAAMGQAIPWMRAHPGGRS